MKNPLIKTSYGNEYLCLCFRAIVNSLYNMRIRLHAQNSSSYTYTPVWTAIAFSKFAKAQKNNQRKANEKSNFKII